MTNPLANPARRPAPAADPHAAIVPIAAIREALWRRRGIIVAATLLAALAGGGLGLMMPRSFTSSAQLLVDPRGLRLLEKDISPQAREPDLSVSIIESEMRFLGSDLVLQRVISKLGLANPGGGEPKQAKSLLGGLMAPIDALKDSLKSLLGRTEIPSNPEQAALVALQRSLKISRQPNTYVLDVTVTGKDRLQAAEIANAIAAEYIGARFDSRAEVSKRASASIDGRLDELRQSVREADAAVEQHKERHGLVQAQGRLLTDQRMGELSTQLQAARAERIRAETRMAEVRAARKTRDQRLASPEALQSPTLERLMTSQAQARQREASLAATLLPSHPLVRQVRQEVQAADRSVEQELVRIAETAQQTLQRARATEQALERQLDDVKTVATREAGALVEMRELERVAEANRNVYQTFLVRTRELVEQQRIDPTSAVILASAEPAQVPNGPGVMPLVLAATIGGLGVGSALALRRDQRDPRVRSALQLESLVPRERLHVVPAQLPRGIGRLLGDRRRDDDRNGYRVADPASATAQAVVRLNRATASGRTDSRQQLILVTAGEPRQGKSFLALNLAVAAARAGDKVVLIDADRDVRTATRAADAGERAGLGEALTGVTPLGQSIIPRHEPPFDLVPTGQLAEVRTTRARLDAIGETVLRPLAGYDVVVVDATATAHDRLTLALAQRADATLVVAHEGSAQKAVLAETIGWLGEASDGGDVHVVLMTG